MKNRKTFLMIIKPPRDESYLYIYLLKGLCSHSNVILIN
jgi:hypothetical protein